MIPVKLKLSNFTSYGENAPELDFTKFKMAAISGSNGAGKSSLLDAITWCLWGTSRAGDSADALIRLGQIQMEADFEFQLDGHLYTVKRRRIKKGGGSTALEFWSNSHNLTEGTIKATQQKIIDTLHLTFETFTNSSFLRQGNADEFTTNGPTDRKRILANILGLDHYDALEEKAKEKAKEAQTKLSVLEYQLIEIEAELSQKEEKEKSATLKEQEAKKAEEEVEILDKMVREIDEQKSTISKSVELLKERCSQIEAVKKELLDLKIQMEIKEKAKQEFQNILDQKQAIEENYQNLQALQEEKKTLDLKRSELIKVKDEWASIQRKLIELEERRNRKVTELEVEIKKIQTQNEQLESEIKKLEENKDHCPTCGGVIGEETNKQIVTGHKRKIDENDKELKVLLESLEKCKSFVLKEKVAADDKEKEVKVFEEQTKGYSEVSSQILSLDKYSDLYVKLQQAETGVKTHQEAIKDLEKIYTSKQSQIEKSENILEELEIYQKKLKEKEQASEAKLLLKQELSKKASGLRQEAGEAKQLISRIEQMEKLNIQKKDERTTLTKEKAIYDELALAFSKKGIQAMIIENAIPEIEDEANRLLDKLTEGRMKVHFETQRETKTKVATLEGPKQHAIVETLDIVISDEMGERPYELYSGGETFRVNFAIRLALSKLLTHRAGARLQFLVIDEGFGTQDSAGRARLVEVIDTIQDDFEKILIITHLEELKEEFPTRIEVSKNTGGSTFQVVGV